MPWLLLRRLRSKNRYTFVRAAERLGALRDRRAVEPLIAALRHPGEWFREAAALALGEIGDRRAVAAVQTAAQDKDPLVRGAVRGALRRLGAPVPEANKKDARPEPTARRTPSKPPVARPASTPPIRPGRIGARAPSSDMLALLDAVAEDGTAKSRQRVAEILASVGDEGAVPVLASLLGDGECEVRRIVVRALARIGTSETVEALVKALHDRDLTTVTTASRALVALGPAALEPLRRTLDDADRRTRQAALETLRRIDPDFTRPIRTKSPTPAQSPAPLTLVTDGATVQRQPALELILALRDEETTIRVAAARILRKLYPGWPRSRNARQAIPDFVAALHADNFRVRAAAARTLGKIGERSTLTVLRLLLDDSRSQVRRAAEEAVEGIEEGSSESTRPPQQSARR